MNTLTFMQADVAGIVYGGDCGWSMGPIEGPPPGWRMTCGGDERGSCRVSFSLKNGSVQSVTTPCSMPITVTFHDWSDGGVYTVEW